MTDNLYYDPEKFNAKIVGTLDFGGGYEFDMHVLWYHENKIKYGYDSGCS